MEAKSSKDFVKTVEIEKDGKLTKFVIKLVPKDRYEEAADHMCNFFIRDEPLSECENLKDDPQAVQEFRKLFRTALDDNISVAAFVDNPQDEKPVLAGINVLYIGGEGQNVDFKPLDNSSEKNKKIMTIMGTLANVDLKKLYDCDKFIGGFGLSVNPAFRGNRIGYHLLMARHEVGEKNDIPVTMTVFTSPISIKLATQAGFEVVLEKSREELVDANGQLLVPTCKSDCFKCMAKRLN